MNKIIDSFTIGGTAAGPSMPGARLQRLIGTRIMVYPMERKMLVPTPDGPVMAGDARECRTGNGAAYRRRNEACFRGHCATV